MVASVPVFRIILWFPTLGLIVLPAHKVFFSINILKFMQKPVTSSVTRNSLYGLLQQAGTAPGHPLKYPGMVRGTS